MKKSLLILSLAILTLRSSAQTIENPFVEKSENGSATITKIATGEHFTAVTLKYTAPADDSWADINKEIFIQTDVDNKHYDFVKATGITFSPEKTTLKKAGDDLVFTVFFNKIPADAKTIDIIERAGPDNSNYFNFYGVHLEKSQTGKVITDVVLTPPPPIPGNNSVVFGGNPAENNMFNAMAPMFGTMIKAVMDAQLSFYQDDNKIKEIAKATHKYYEALITEGFSQDQALKIITSESLLPKGNLSSK
ncbi:hypothetical protein ACFS5N_07230 [Mucilaginibacter ximonensis]|uniref:Uncharacterized protein n=1 Tax=Mucilaginibacter ximonensis TaxID=538021 RepID=A0ABW5YBQ3_9SPHI